MENRPNIVFWVDKDQKETGQRGVDRLMVKAGRFLQKKKVVLGGLLAA